MEAGSPFRSVTGFALAAVLGCVAAQPSLAQLTINEVLYDPEGPDSGFEWVELHNGGPWPAPLEGVTLEFGNGSSPGEWDVLWQGRSEDWIEAGGVLWIGGSYRGRAADVPADLALQNGPDGIRLGRFGVVLDTVGWGELTRPDAYEGTPAAPTGSGASLARIADGYDTHDNRTDFESAAPTPGRENRPARDIALEVPEHWRALPVGARARVYPIPVTLRNLGRDPLVLSDLEFWARGVRRDLSFEPSAFPLAPGAAVTTTIELRGPFPEGGRSWGLRADTPGDGNPDNDADSVLVWVGPAPVEWTEVYPRPRPGEFEWIELTSRRDDLDLEGWAVSDADAHRVVLAAPARLVRSGTAALLADRDAVFSDEVFRLGFTGAWPNLNDGTSGVAAADTLFLADPAGRIVDWCAYGFAARGVPWTRRTAPQADAVVWVAEDDRPGGTPGRSEGEPPSRGPEGSSNLGPARLSLDRFPGGAWIRLSADSFPGAYRVRLFDLAGRLHWSASGRAAAREVQWCLWPGADQQGRRLPVGLYLVRAEIESAQGRISVEQAALAVTP